MTLRPATYLPKISTIALAAALLPLPLLAQDAAAPFRLAYEVNLDLDNSNALLVAEILGDDSPELVLTDAAGNVQLRRAATGELLATRAITPKVALTAPICGDFFGRNRMDVALGTLDGRVIFLEGTTLRVLAEFALPGSARVELQPSTIPAFKPGFEKEGLSNLPLAGLDRDICLVADANGVLHALRGELVAGEKGATAKVTTLWQQKTGVALSGAPAVGFVRSKDRLDIVGGTKDGRLYIFDAGTGEFISENIWENKTIAFSPLIADVTGPGGVNISPDGLGEIYLINVDGAVKGIRIDMAKPKPFQTFAENRISGSPVTDGGKLLAVSGSAQPAAILFASDSTMTAFDYSLSNILLSDVKFTPKTTRLALLPQRERRHEVVAGVGKNIGATRLIGESISTGGTKSFEQILNAANEDLRGVPGVLFVPGERAMSIVGVSKGERLRRWETNFTSMPTMGTNIYWETPSGNAWHTSTISIDYHDVLKTRRSRLAAERSAKEAAYESASGKGEWGDALAAAEWLVSVDPYRQEFSGFQRTAWLRKHLLELLAGGLTFLGITGYAAFLLTRALTRGSALRRASSLANAGQLEEARRVYERLYAKIPKNPRVFHPLAMLYAKLRDYSAETLPVYERAYNAQPDNAELMHAYTRALAREPVATDAAQRIYERAISTFPEPSLLEYAIGMCQYRRNEFESAGKRLRAALRGGLVTDAVYATLSDIYLKTGLTTAKALPVFQQQYPSRQDDQKFLEAYLLAAIDARKTDSEVETLCHQVLEGNQRFTQAYCHLAAIHLQRNAVGPAIEEIRQALQHDAQNQTAQSLLAHCFLIQQRKDDEALAAYRVALTHDPQNKELLRTIAEINFDRGRFDGEASDIYRRSLSENPGETTTLKALAQVALLTSDHELGISSIEALQQQGQMNQKLTRQLAQAYLRQNIFEPRAERVYREALRLDPKNIEFLGALCQSLRAQDRTDSEAVPVYESYLASQPDDLAIGKQLAKAYVATQRYDNALKLAQQLQQKHRADEDLKRVIALSSLYGNRIDEAISEYQTILSQNPNDADAALNLALAYAQKHRTDDDATRLYLRAFELRPDNENLPLALARASLSKNDHLKAVEWYQKALRARAGAEALIIEHLNATLVESPDALRIRWFLAEVLVAYNRLREALDQLVLIFDTAPGQAKNVLSALDKVLAKDPNNINAQIQKGRILIASGSPQHARKALEAASALQPNNTDVQKYLATAYEAALQEKEDIETRFLLGKSAYVLGDYDKAIGCFQKTAQDYRWEAESTKALGKCFTAKGMLDLALQEYKKLVVDEETKELLYDLAQRYEAKKDLVGAKTVYRQLFAADINYKDVRRRFEMLSGSTSDPMVFEKTSIVQEMSEEAARRYELLEELGRGAMGIVYRAKDRELEEVVALKILPDAMSNNPEAVRRFKIEARNARKLAHPHIVRIHDIGEEMGRKYISMEYVDGADLKRRVKGGPKMTMKEIFHYGMQIADALGYAHRLGIVHRDIKPANIMLTSTNDVKITDFGIAKLLDQTGEGTMVGAVIGTPLYMSPEQVQGIPVDNRADIYSYGIMLYEFVNTKPPFTEGDLAYQHIHREVPPIEGCPEPLWNIIKKCLNKKKEDRWQNAEEIYDAMRSVKDRVVAMTGG